MKWYRLAAEQGNGAQFNLGLMYKNGQSRIMSMPICGSISPHHRGLSARSSSNRPTENLLAKLMTPSQLEKAQELARECVRKQYKGC